MRLLLDTTILARAAASSRGPARAVLDIALGAEHTLITSDYLLSEVFLVLHKDYLQAIHGLSEPDMRAYVENLRVGSLVVPIPPMAVRRIVPADPNDDPIVAAAILGKAEVICTWDNDFFEASVLRRLAQFGIEVLRDGELLRRLRSRRAA
jgi:uncharacterized protein